jgi:hypothetical protein
VASPAYSTVLRQTLFLGLSDGARTDVFRRAHPHISNEQLWHAYDISDEKAASMGKKLTDALRAQLEREPAEAESCFHTVCLLDDFTASGTSYIRQEGAQWAGKIPRILDKLAQTDRALHKIVTKEGLDILVCIYVASDQAIQHIRGELKTFPFPKGSVRLEVIHALPPETRLDNAGDAKIMALANDDRYWDNSADDEHGEVGALRHGLVTLAAGFRSSWSITRLTIQSSYYGANMRTPLPGSSRV